MTLAGLGPLELLMLLGVTGWILYLVRRPHAVPAFADAPRAGKRALVVDALLAVATFSVTLVILRGMLDTNPVVRDLDTRAILLVALSSLPLIVRRRALLPVFVVMSVAAAALNLFGYELGLGVGSTVALFFLAVSPSQTTAAQWQLLMAAVVGMFALQNYADFLVGRWSPTPLGAVFWLAVWMVGDWMRQRRERLADLVRAARDADRDRRLAIAEERAQIARDLHDSAGHAISVIMVQAGAARLLGDRDPARVRTALETIEDVGRDTLTEIDRLVRALRDEDGHDIERPPGLDALDALVDRHRASGLDVTVTVTGSPSKPSPVVDQAAYRILQEALTNATRHGGGHVAVELRFTDDMLDISVDNPIGTTEAGDQGGQGLLGMRERAELLGGDLDVSPDGDTFRVRARLPYHAQYA